MARDPEGPPRSRADPARRSALLDGLASPDRAVLGRFTIADCAVAPVLFRTTQTGLDLGPHPTLTALRENLLSRPAFARADPVG